jgi:hypothetical protein
MRKLFAIAIVGFGVPSAAFAQSCTTPSSSGNTPPRTCLSGGVPQLSGLTGSANIVRNGSVLQAKAGMRLQAGDRLVTRANDSGTFSMSGAQGGSCSLAILANSSVTISQSGGSTCVSQRTSVISNPQAQVPEAQVPQTSAASAPLPEVPVAPVAPVASVSQGLSPLAYGIGGSIIAGAAGIAISQSRNDRLSP